MHVSHTNAAAEIVSYEEGGSAGALVKALPGAKVQRNRTETADEPMIGALRRGWFAFC